jgi:integrase
MPTRISQAVWHEKYQRWQINVQFEGKRRSFYSSTPGAKGERECNGKADKWLQDKLVNENTRTSKMFEKYLEELKITTSKGNWMPQESHWKAWIEPEFGAKKIGKVNEQDLKNVITAAHKKGRSKKMLTNIRNTMMSFLKYCRANHCTTLRPEEIKIPNDAPESNKKPIQPSDIKKLFASSTSTWRCKPCEDRLVHAYRFVVAVGLRPGELIGLQRINLEGNVIKVRGSINKYNDKTKGKNRRAIRTYKIGKIALGIWKEQQDMLKREGVVSSYAFPDKDGGPLTLVHLEKAWERYRSYNGIEKTTPYEMRHTFVSMNKDMPEALKKLVLGHSEDMDTEGTYGHEMEGDLDRAAKMMDKALAKIIGRKI